MKQKRTFIAVLLVIAVLALGVAYASISQITLTVNGTAQAIASDNNFNVVMTSAADPVAVVASVEGTEIVQDITASVKDDLTAELTAKGLTTVGDKVTYVFNITNESEEFGADLALAEGDAEFTVGTFNVTAELGKASLNANGDTTTLTIVVELNETPKADQAEQSIQVQVLATLAE